MAKTFFFYDIETSGFMAKRARIMQFAGQRTDENLNPIGSSYDLLIKITEDVIPQPDAILVTKITPQKTLQDGITEAEFCSIFTEEIATENTCFVGFNSIRFDDEFVRHTLYRNYHEPYTWQWSKGRSRWDILDVARMTRALRPDKIKWPFDNEGNPTNRLELLTEVNKLKHINAHDGLSDVFATIQVAQLILSHQPKLFKYLYEIRTKQAVTKFLSQNKSFVYTSGKFSSKYSKTTVVYNLGPHPSGQGVLVYDLRENPEQFINMNVSELAECWKSGFQKEGDGPVLPIKAMQINRCPAMAPLSVLDPDTQARLELDMQKINNHQKTLVKNLDIFYEKLRDAADYLNKNRAEKRAVFASLSSPDEQLYDGFISSYDQTLATKIVSSKPAEISKLAAGFKDDRLKKILPLYKARNFSKYLTDEERDAWEEHRKHMLLGGGENSQVAKFSQRLSELSKTVLDSETQYLLQELQLYVESILPEYTD